MRIRHRHSLQRVVVVGALALAGTFSGLALAQQSSQDESDVASIHLAARAGDFDLARQRLEALEKEHLVAMGLAALASEYARDAQIEPAEDLFKQAEDQASAGQMRARERATAYLYIAQMLDQHEHFSAQVPEALSLATNAVGSLAGFELDFSLAELAAVTYKINGDLQEAREIVGLIADERLRDKLVVLYAVPEEDS